MTESPGSVLRAAVAGLNPEMPGALFRITVAEKSADIVDAYWKEIGEIGGLDDDRHGAAYMGMAHALGSILTGTVGYFQDREAVADTMCTLAVAIGDCELYLDCPMIPPRPVVEVAKQTLPFGEDEE
jgi:hypothetical protein